MVVEVPHNDDVRLIPLDTWERDWIRGALQHALGHQALSRIDKDQEFRLRALFSKIHPRYSRVDAQGNVLELTSPHH
jgi:hypothetical protein